MTGPSVGGKSEWFRAPRGFSGESRCVRRSPRLTRGSQTPNTPGPFGTDFTRSSAVGAGCSCRRRSATGSNGSRGSTRTGRCCAESCTACAASKSPQPTPPGSTRWTRRELRMSGSPRWTESRVASRTEPSRPRSRRSWRTRARSNVCDGPPPPSPGGGGGWRSRYLSTIGAKRLRGRIENGSFSCVSCTGCEPSSPTPRSDGGASSSSTGRRRGRSSDAPRSWPGGGRKSRCRRLSPAGWTPPPPASTCVARWPGTCASGVARTFPTRSSRGGITSPRTGG